MGMLMELMHFFSNQILAEGRQVTTVQPALPEIGAVARIKMILIQACYTSTKNNYSGIAAVNV